jgi:hypothetical protein
MKYRIEVNGTTRALIVAALMRYSQGEIYSWPRVLADDIANLPPVDPADDGPEIGILMYGDLKHAYGSEAPDALSQSPDQQ